jgi:hypothetical protein
MFGVNSLPEGLLVAFLIWLGFIVTTQYSAVIWAKKPLNVFLCDIGCELLSLLAMGAILSLWR